MKGKRRKREGEDEKERRDGKGRRGRRGKRIRAKRKRKRRNRRALEPRAGPVVGGLGLRKARLGGSTSLGPGYEEAAQAGARPG